MKKRTVRLDSMTKAEENLVDRMSYDEYMKFAAWIVKQKDNTCRLQLDKVDGYQTKGGVSPP